MNTKVSLQQIIAHSKAYGFVYNASEIYGGLQAVYDYGPYGVLLKRRVQDFWWRSMTGLHANIVGLDSAILMARRVWEASGHVAGFHDWLVDHKVSKKRYRVDVLLEGYAAKLRQRDEGAADEVLKRMGGLMEAKDGEGLTRLLMECGIVCPVGKTSEWTVAREFNLMLATDLGAVKEAGHQTYLRPETAQGIFVNFLHIQKTARLRVPFGVAQIGKAFRNEIVARQFIFRMREFEQMEMQFFVRPEEASRWFKHWIKVRGGWYKALGIMDLRVKAHDQLAHYADAAVDLTYGFPFGYKEVEGVHNRTDFDLKSHTRFSSKQLTYFDAQDEHYVPYVIETSVGCDRLVLMLLCDAFTQEAQGDGIRTYLRFPPALAPIQVAVFPLMKKKALVDEAKRVFGLLCCDFSAAYEERGSIGKRYTRQDLLGTPYCVTIDFDTLVDKKVTIRDRDTMKQLRVCIDDVPHFLEERVGMRTLLERVRGFGT